MICGLVVRKIYKYEFRLYLQNLSGICKMGITFAYELGLKSFLYEKSSTRKFTSEFNGGTWLIIFKILKNLTEKKLRGFQDLEGKNSKNFKLTSGALFARCDTSNRKKMLRIFLEFLFKKWYVIWPGSLKYFSKFHHTHEHEQSPRHQQGIIGLIW